MSDHIGGVAILDRRDPRREHLYCFGFRDAKTPTYICIPIRSRGTPETSCTWEYDIQGDVIHVTPSVRQMGGPNGAEMFHNTADWRVKFKEVEADPYQELLQLNPEAAATRFQ